MSPRPTSALVRSITPENVTLEQWPKDRVPAGTVIRQEDLDGRRARQKIYAGEPMIEPKLLARGQSPIDGMVPRGLRVVPVAVGLEAIHGGLVLPGSRCNVQVLIRADPAVGVPETLCKTILQDIRVFAVNDVTSTESQDRKTPDTRSIPTGKTVSLLVTPVQAQTVTLASQLGSIRLILRSGDDAEQTKIADMTFREMLGAHDGSDRAKEKPEEADAKRFKAWADMMRKAMQNARATPNRQAEEPERFKMRIRAGAEVSDVLLTANSGVHGLPGDEGTWTAVGMGPVSHGKANPDTHPSTKPGDAGPAALLPARGAPSQSGTGSLPSPAKSGSPQSPGG